MFENIIYHPKHNLSLCLWGECLSLLLLKSKRTPSYVCTYMCIHYISHVGNDIHMYLALKQFEFVFKIPTQSVSNCVLYRPNGIWVETLTIKELLSYPSKQFHLLSVVHFSSVLLETYVYPLWESQPPCALLILTLIGPKTTTCAHS